MIIYRVEGFVLFCFYHSDLLEEVINYGDFINICDLYNV